MGYMRDRRTEVVSFSRDINDIYVWISVSAAII